MGRFILCESNGTPFVGTVTNAIAPAAVAGHWLFDIEYEDGHRDQRDLSGLLSFIIPLGGGGSTSEIAKSNEQWRKYKARYSCIMDHLEKDTFTVEGSAGVALLKKVFGIRRDIDVTVTNIRRKWRTEVAKHLHPDKVTGQNAQVRYLAKLLLAAAHHLYLAFERAEGRGDDADVPDSPDLRSYFRYNSEPFVAAAGLDPDALTQPDPPADDPPADPPADEYVEDPHGRDAPSAPDPSILLSDGSLPRSFDCIDAFDMEDFRVSPFQHVNTIDKSLLSKYLVVISRILRQLNDAVESRDGVDPAERRRLIGTRARWYLGFPQLFFRCDSSKLNSAKQLRQVRSRLNQYLHGDYHLLVAAWRRDYEKQCSKTRNQRVDTGAARALRAVQLVKRKFISRATNLVHSNGVASWTPAMIAQMVDKHPVTDEHDWEPPLPVDMDLSKLRDILADADPLTGVGPRGLKSTYLSVLVNASGDGDPEAAAAYPQFQRLGKLYCNAMLPPWLNFALGGGALTAVLKKALEELEVGAEPDGRPVKAEDADTSSFTKSVQRDCTAAVLETVRPQQLGVKVSGGVETVVLGVKLWFEEQKHACSRRAVALKLDIRNAHNSFSRPAAMAALKLAAATSDSHAMLARAWHAMTFQKNPIYIRDPSAATGWRFLCFSSAGGGQGNALTSLVFVMVIDAAIKATELKFGITIRAIQDDMTLLGDAADIFGVNGALEFLLAELAKVGLEPNRGKFNVVAVSDDAIPFIPDWLKTDKNRAFFEVEDPSSDSGGTIRAYGMELLGAPIGEVLYENEWLAAAATKISGNIHKITTAIGSLCPHAAHAVTLYSSQALGDYICASNPSCQTLHFRRVLDKALREAYSFIYHVDFLDPDGHELNLQDPAFVRDLFCLKTSQSGGGCRPYVERFNFLNAINNALPQMIDRHDPESGATVKGYWSSVLTARIGAGSFDMSEEAVKTRFATFLGCGYGRISQDLSSEIARAKDTWLEALEAAGIDPDSDFLKKSPLAVPAEGFGEGYGKLQKATSEEIQKYRSLGMGRRARALPLDDQRRMAYLSRFGDRFASQFLAGCPDPSVNFHPDKFRLAVQRLFGVPLSALKHIIGARIQNHANSPQRTVDPHGNNLSSISGSVGDHSRKLHDFMLEFVIVQLRKIGIRVNAAKKGHPSTAGIFTHLLQEYNATLHPSKEAVQLVNGILPDMLLNATGPLANEFSSVTCSTFFDYVETLLDVKGYGLGESSRYQSFRAEPSDLKPVDRRAREVHKEYIYKARRLDALYHSGTPTGVDGPVLSRLLSFGAISGPNKGRVVGLAIGCFGELSSEFGELCSFIARNMTVEHLQYYDNKTPEQALNMFRSRIQSVWGHAATFAWADLILDRSRTLVGLQSPAATAAAAAAADPDLDNYDLFHATHPDFGQGVQARTWRANRQD